MSKGNTHKLPSPHLSAICIHIVGQLHVKGKYSQATSTYLSGIYIHIVGQFHVKGKYSPSIIDISVSHLYPYSWAVPCQREILTHYHHHIYQPSVSNSRAVLCQREILTSYHPHIYQPSVFTQVRFKIL
jgi:hypothetical protein